MRHQIHAIDHARFADLPLTDGEQQVHRHTVLASEAVVAHRTQKPQPIALYRTAPSPQLRDIAEWARHGSRSQQQWLATENSYAQDAARRLSRILYNDRWSHAFSSKFAHWRPAI